MNHIRTLESPGDRQGQGHRLPVLRVTYSDWGRYPYVIVGKKGRVTLVTQEGVYNNGRDPDLREKVQVALDENFGVKPKDGIFYRYTNNPKELLLAERHELRASRDQRDGTLERGVSVSQSPVYGVMGYKYAYRLTGRVIGTGSDGEPLLDPASLRPLQKKLTAASAMSANYSKLREAAIQAGLKRLDWTREQYEAARNNFQFVPLVNDYKEYVERHQLPSRETTIAQRPPVQPQLPLRDQRALHIDQAVTARTILDPTNDLHVRRYRLHPNRYDIPGVDTKMPRAARRAILGH